jgi:hypothetical protein
MAREGTRVTSHIDLRSKFRCRVLVSRCGEPAMSKRNEVRSEVADRDTVEGTGISDDG